MLLMKVDEIYSFKASRVELLNKSPVLCSALVGFDCLQLTLAAVIGLTAIVLPKSLSIGLGRILNLELDWAQVSLDSSPRAPLTLPPKDQVQSAPRKGPQ